MNIAEARSYKNGIDFYVNSKRLTIKARREEDGKISVTTTHDAPQVERTQYRTLIVLGLTAIAVIFWNILKETTLGYKLIGGLGCLWILVYGYYFITSKIASNKPSFKYHAAEHKVLNYYEKHKCIPTQVEELAKEKSISYRCGSTVIAVFLVFVTIIGIVFAITSIWWIRLISFGLAVYTVLAMWANGLCDFLQKYALLEPGREELEVALKGIEEYDRINTSL